MHWLIYCDLLKTKKYKKCKIHEVYRTPVYVEMYELTALFCMLDEENVSKHVSKHSVFQQSGPHKKSSSITLTHGVRLLQF